MLYMQESSELWKCTFQLEEAMSVHAMYTHVFMSREKVANSSTIRYWSQGFCVRDSFRSLLRFGCIYIVRSHFWKLIYFNYASESVCIPTCFIGSLFHIPSETMQPSDTDVWTSSPTQTYCYQKGDFTCPIELLNFDLIWDLVGIYLEYYIYLG